MNLDQSDWEPRPLPPLKYQNQKPSTDKVEILGWLEGAGDRRLWVRDGVAWVAVHHFGALGHHSGTEEYLVDLATALELAGDRHLNPTKHLGYTDPDELQINNSGRAYYYGELKPVRKVARS